MKNLKRALIGLGAASGLAVGGIALAPGAAQSAVNYFDTTKTVYSSVGTANCGAGWRATGGGFKVPNDTFYSYSSAEYKVTSSTPYGTGSWRVTAQVTRGSYSNARGWTFRTSTYTPTAYVVCTR
jgi:hypothetical protein